MASVQHYLKTIYHPDCDFVDGVVEERNFCDVDHAYAQSRLTYLLMELWPKTGLLPIVELRMQTRSNRYRIPDVVLTKGKPAGRILTTPPVLCIEVLSPEDRMSRINTRVREYLDFGVPTVWVVDPAEKRVWIYRNSGMEEAHEKLTLEGTTIEIAFDEIFN